MGLFEVDEEKLKGLYHRAWVESGHGFVDPRKYSYLNHAIMQLCNMQESMAAVMTRH